MKRSSLLFAFILISFLLGAQPSTKYYLTADRVFDRENMHEGWAVITEGNKIIAAGPKEKVKEPTGPSKKISDLRKVKFVMKDGVVYRNE